MDIVAYIILKRICGGSGIKENQELRTVYEYLKLLDHDPDTIASMNEEKLTDLDKKTIRILREYLMLTNIDGNQLGGLSSRRVYQLDYTEKAITEEAYEKYISGSSGILPKLALLGIFSPIAV